MDRFIKKVIPFVLFFYLLFASTLNAFDGTETENWLVSEINTNMLMENQTDIALTVQAARESVLALQQRGTLSRLDESMILAVFDSVDENSTELLASKIIVYKAFNKELNTLLDKLKNLQNNDGGFGHSKSYQSTVLDTALALKALSLFAENAPVISSAVSYLSSHQLSNGSWSDFMTTDPSYLTTLAMRALWMQRKSFDIQASLELAKLFLASQPLEDETFLNALVLRSIAPLYYSSNDLTDRLNAVRQSQKTDGSWEEGIYTTALALQALDIADKEVPNPDLATLSGIVVDGDSGIALSNISVELESISTLATGGDGRFAFSGLQNASYTLHITSSNYAPLHTTVRMVGDNIDLGTLRLNKNADATISTLTGIIKDAKSGELLSGVKVTVGDKEVITDSSGSYTIDSIEAGSYTLVLQKAGYIQENKNITIPSNTILRYDASLRSFDFTVIASILGTIVDSDTLTPLIDVDVNLILNTSTQAYQTTQDGNFEFKDLKQGEYRLEIQKTEYHSVYTSFTIETTQNINYGIIKLNKIDENASAYATVQGAVTDIYTKEPIINALVDVSGITTLTLADGSYTLKNVSVGEVVLQVSKEGYTSATGTTTLTNGSTLIFSPSLKPIDEGNLKLFGTLLDADTSEPLSDVNVTVTGATEASVYTSTYGYYVIDALNSGDITIKATKFGYKTVIITTTVSDTNIEFSPTMQKETSLNGETTLSGNVLDVGNHESLSDVKFFINHIDTGIRSDADGNFTIENILATDVNLTLKKDGYKDVHTLLILSESQDLQLGTLYMRSDVEDLKSDLTAEVINTASLVNNINTLEVTGDINVTVVNRGTIPSDAFDVIAFYDTNADGNFTEGEDRVFSSHRVESGLDVDESYGITFEVDTVVDFREQPIYIYVDSKNENVELDEDNLYNTAKSCGGKQGKIDLGICFDYSGSVGSLANLQKNGLIQALRDPTKFPRDGSIRLTIMTARNYTFLQPTIITDENAENIADQMSNTRFYGNSYVDDCLRYMADKLHALPEQSTYKAITLSGDGYWGGSIAYDRDYAISKGVNVIDAIAIGRYYRWSTLDGIVYPQPAGGDFGVVHVAKTSEEVSNSLVRTFKKQTEISDLTLGKLEIIDNGSEQNISIRFTVGNAGVATVSNGIDISIFEGDPKENGVLLATTALENNLSFGMSMVIQIDDVALQEGGSIYVVGDYQNNLVECTKENNVITSIINATTTLGEIVSHTDKSNYSANKTALLFAEITNPGRLSYELTAQLILEDTNGNTLKTLNPVDLGIVGSGESRTISSDWNTTTTLAGEYILKGVLTDSQGNIVDESTTNFNIISDNADGVSATLDTSTDRLRYHTTDNINISNFIQSLSSNSIITNAKVVLEIVDANGIVIQTQTLQLGELLPSATKENGYQYSYVRLATGNYSVNASLYSNDNRLFATDTAMFEVYEDLSKGIKGSVEVAWYSDAVGTVQQCSYSVTNFGSTALNGLPLELRVLDLNNTKIKETVPTTVDIKSTQTLSKTENFDTNGYTASDYSCALYMNVEGTWLLVDHKPFTLTLPPILIDGSLTQEGKGRILILLDPCKHTDESNSAEMDCSEPFGSSEAIDLPMQRSYLERLLLDNGYSYSIVTDANSFTTELHSGAYSLYALLDETVKLSKSVQKELREAVFKGEGLLVSGTHDSRNHFVYETMGVKYEGHFSKANGVEVTESPYVAFEATLLPKSQPIRFISDDTTPLASYTFEESDQREKAVVKYAFGKGESIFAGYDILAHASTDYQNSSLQDPYGNFLLEILSDLYSNTDEFNKGSIIPMTLHIENQGIATPLRADLSTTPNAHFVDAIDAKELNATTLSFEEELFEENGQRDYRFWLQALEASNPIELTADILSLLNGEELQQAHFDYSILVGGSEDIETILVSVLHIELTDKKDQKELNQAIRDLGKAKEYLQDSNLEKALSSFISATDALQKIEDKEAIKTSRVMIDNIIRETEIQMNKEGN